MSLERAWVLSLLRHTRYSIALVAISISVFLVTNANRPLSCLLRWKVSFTLLVSTRRDISQPRWFTPVSHRFIPHESTRRVDNDDHSGARNMAFPSHYFPESISADEMGDDLECVICQQDFQSPVSLSMCQHTFCEACLQQWLNVSNTCPICRQVNRLSYVPAKNHLASHELHHHRLAQVRPMITGLIDEWRSIRRKQLKLQDSFDRLETKLSDLLHSMKNAEDWLVWSV